MNNPQAIPTSICAAGALLREVIQSQLNELEPLQRSKLQLALRPDCMSEAMKESLARCARSMDSRSTPQPICLMRCWIAAKPRSRAQRLELALPG